MFPLYFETGIPLVVAQDISRAAIRLCKCRFPNSRVKYRTVDILRLNYPQAFFDLIVSNRVLSAISPARIDAYLGKLVHIGKHIYINETTGDEKCAPNNYWFVHDYSVLEKKYGSVPIDSGITNGKRWLIYRCKAI